MSTRHGESEPMSDLEKTQAALTLTLRAISATLTAYAELAGMPGNDDEEVVYETLSGRLLQIERLRAQAWDEGHRAAVEEIGSFYSLQREGEPRQPPANPYRETTRSDRL